MAASKSMLVTPSQAAQLLKGPSAVMIEQVTSARQEVKLMLYQRYLVHAQCTARS